MCSFAKFLALGLIASEGRGPVAVEALSAEKYKEIVGAAYTGDTNTAAQIQTAACAHMYVSYKDLATPTPPDLGISGLQVTAGAVTTCSTDAFTELGKKMLDKWKADANALELTIPDESNATIAGAATNVKQLLLNALQTRYTALNSGTGLGFTAGDAFNKRIKEVKQELWLKRTAEYKNVAGAAYDKSRDNSTPLTPQLVAVRSAIADAKEKQAAAAKKPNEQVPPASAPSPAPQKTKEEVPQVPHPSTSSAAGDEAAAKKKAEEEAAERAEAVGGFFGVFFGLVGLTLAFLMSPCVQFDFNTGKTATNWATGEVDDEWTQMEMYKEAYKTDKTPEQWRNEVFGLPEQPVDSAKATSSALTLVPVVVLAGGVFAVARRGLKRRAQKKAKRVSRAQQKLHEDL